MRRPTFRPLVDHIKLGEDARSRTYFFAISVISQSSRNVPPLIDAPVWLVPTGEPAMGTILAMAAWQRCILGSCFPDAPGQGETCSPYAEVLLLLICADNSPASYFSICNALRAILLQRISSPGQASLS